MIRKTILIVLLAASAPLAAVPVWELRLSFGPWTLQPVTAPVERLAERIVSDEVNALLFPLLGDLTVISFEPRITMDSRGSFISAGLWRQVAADRFAVGLTFSYLRAALPFSLADEQAFFYQGLPLAKVTTSGEGRIDLRSVILTAQGRWRAWQRGRLAVYASLGLALLGLAGDLDLPLTARIDTLFGSAELKASEEMSLDELRKRNDGVPAWSAAPALGLSLNYRLGGTGRLFIEAGLSQGTFLAAGAALVL